MKNFKSRLLTVFIISLPVLLILYLFVFDYNSALVNIDQKKFETIVLNGDAKKIILVANKNVVEVSLTDEALRKKEYLDAFPHVKFINKNEPQFSLRIPSA